MCLASFAAFGWMREVGVWVNRRHYSVKPRTRTKINKQAIEKEAKEKIK